MLDGRGVLIRRVVGADHEVLFGAHDSLNHRAHRFEVRRVRRHRDVDGRATGILENTTRSLVVLHVTTALDTFGIEVAFEFGENVAVGLTNDVREHVEATSVSHPNDGFSNAAIRRSVENRLQGHDGRLSALEPEALLTDVTRVQKTLKDFCFV